MLYDPPAGSGVTPQLKSNLVHFCIKICHLVVNFNDFITENHLTKYRDVYTVKAKQFSRHASPTAPPLPFKYARHCMFLASPSIQTLNNMKLRTAIQSQHSANARASSTRAYVL